MRHLRSIGAVLAAFAALGALGAGSASAAKPGLQLKQEGVAVATGAPVAADLYLGACYGFSEGTLGSNGKSKDTASFTKVTPVECEGADTTSGQITSLQLSTAGVASLKSTVVLGTPGTCNYAFKKLSGKFPVPGTVLFEGEATGKLAKGSAKTCAKTITEFFLGDLTNTREGSPFEDSIG